MKTDSLTRVALRYRALFLDVDRNKVDMTSAATAPVMSFVRRLNDNGFCVSEELLHALNATTVERLAEINACINDVMGVNLNWTPLVKDWTVPTNESLADHLVTLFVNLFDNGKDGNFKGVRLPCGHLIPEGTFPMERYNGCPFCGTPFVTSDTVYRGQGSKLKELRLFTLEDIHNLFISLLSSSVPLDGTQNDTLTQLLNFFPLPDNPQIAMKETVMLVSKRLMSMGRNEEIAKLLRTPADILRFLWFQKTGFMQIVEPRTLKAHARRLNRCLWGTLDRSKNAEMEMEQKLRLKYTRPTCLSIAVCMNRLPMSASQAAEIMNPKRGMWVRFIRALRLGEYSRKPGFEHLAEILDTFYHGVETWQGRVDRSMANRDIAGALSLLKQRPGLFARCLCATMLRFGAKPVIEAFDEIADRLPMRLLLSLGNAAHIYFETIGQRVVRPIIGDSKIIPTNPHLELYSLQERLEMAKSIDDVYKRVLERRFAATSTDSKTIYIAPMLRNIPVAVGDRATTIQDTSCALQGTRFPVEGDSVRLFLQWGKGLHAQHLDMDLSCSIAYADKTEACAFFNLAPTGAKHSGDIQRIPEMVGTAEYIELSLPELEQAQARYVTFTCNAYTRGALSPNLVVGWMDSAFPMKVSEKNGVAYDPSCVQHMVRISDGDLSKGLVFGVLDVAAREIIWLELPLVGQTVNSLNLKCVELMLRRLSEKISIGELLEIKANTQQLTMVDTPDRADEAYTLEWALNPADVTSVLIPL